MFKENKLNSNIDGALDPEIYNNIKNLLSDCLDIFIEKSNENNIPYKAILGAVMTLNTLKPCIIYNDCYISICNYEEINVAEIMAISNMVYDYNKFYITKSTDGYDKYFSTIQLCNQYQEHTLDIMKNLLQTKINDIKTIINISDIITSDNESYFAYHQKGPYYPMCVVNEHTDGNESLINSECILDVTLKIYDVSKNRFIDRDSFKDYNIPKYCTILFMDNVENFQKDTMEHIVDSAMELYLNKKVIPHPVSLREKFMDTIIHELETCKDDKIFCSLIDYAFSKACLTFTDYDNIVDEYKKTFHILTTVPYSETEDYMTEYRG